MPQSSGAETGARTEPASFVHSLRNSFVRRQVIDHRPAGMPEDAISPQVDRLYDQAGNFIYTVDVELDIDKLSYDELRGTLREITKPVYDLVNPRLRSEMPDVGFNSHNIEDHIDQVADFADQICKESLLSEHLRKLVLLGVYGHDLGNINSRGNHSHDSTILFPHIIPSLKRFKDLDIVLEAMRYHDESTLLKTVEKNTGKNRDEYTAIDVLKTVRKIGEQIAETRGLQAEKPDAKFGTVPEWFLEVVPGYDEDFLYGNEEYRRVVNDFRTVQAVLFIADKADISRRRVDKERNTMDVMKAYQHYRNNLLVSNSALEWQYDPFHRDYQRKFEVVLEFNPVLDKAEYDDFEQVSEKSESGGRRINTQDLLAENRTLSNDSVPVYMHWMNETFPMYMDRFFISAALAPVVFPGLETFEVAMDEMVEYTNRNDASGRRSVPLHTSSFIFHLTDEDQINAVYKANRERFMKLPARQTSDV